MKRGAFWVISLIDEYTEYLEAQGVAFTEEGFPQLPQSCFLDEWPDRVVTYKYRNSRLVTDKRRTVLCLYAPDNQIFPRLDKVFDELGEYSQYMGAVMSDATVTWDMDPDFQVEMMLLNQLYMAVLAMNGIKVIANTRCGKPDTVRYLGAIPHGVMWASGFLGCERESDPASVSFISKILAVRPSKLLLYGKRDPVAESRLDSMGVNYRRYPDVHAEYKNPKLKVASGA